MLRLLKGEYVTIVVSENVGFSRLEEEPILAKVCIVYREFQTQNVENFAWKQALSDAVMDEVLIYSTCNILILELKWSLALVGI